MRSYVIIAAPLLLLIVLIVLIVLASSLYVSTCAMPDDETNVDTDDNDVNDEFYRVLTNKNRPFVDKSLLIRDLLSSSVKLNVICQPKGYGKTFNMRMLKRFLTVDPERNGTNSTTINYKLFAGGEITVDDDDDGGRILTPLRIASDANSMHHRGRYPVVFISFGDILDGDYSNFLETIRSRIRKSLLSIAREYSLKFDDARYSDDEILLTDLIESLNNRFGNVYAIVDEYDTPIMNSYVRFGRRTDDFENVLKFFRRFYRRTILSNARIEKVFLTGIVPLRTLFADDNVRYCTIFDNDLNCSRYFGFDEREVIDLFRRASLFKQADFETIAKWHVGYNNFDNGERVYVPWSIVRYIDENGQIKRYWQPKPDKSFVERCLESERLFEQNQLLASGREVSIVPPSTNDPLKIINDDRNGNEEEKNRYALLTILVYSGYAIPALPTSKHVAIVNVNTQYIFKSGILKYVCRTLNVSDYEEFYSLAELLTTERLDEFARRLTAMLSNLPDRLKNAAKVDANLPHLQAYHQLRSKYAPKPIRLFYRGLLLSLIHALYPSHVLTNKRYLGEEKVTAVIYPNSNRADNAILIKYTLVENDQRLQSESKRQLEIINDKSYNRKTSKHPCVKKFTKICLTFNRERVAVEYKQENFQ